MGRIGASRIFAHPNIYIYIYSIYNWLLYFILDVSTCFCSTSPKICSKKIPTNQGLHKVKELFGWASFHLWLSIPPQIPTKSSLRMLSTVAPPRFGSWAPWMARRNYASVHHSRCQTLEGRGGVVRWRFMIFMMRWKYMYWSILIVQWFLSCLYTYTCIWYRLFNTILLMYFFKFFAANCYIYTRT